MNTITVNLENLTDAECQQLRDIVEKSQKPKRWWEGTKFDVKEDEWHYYIDNDGEVEKCCKITAEKRLFGNACTDREYMERRAKEIELYNLLSNFAEVVNEGWQPDWKYEEEVKYHILRNHKNGIWGISVACWAGSLNGVYFKTEELAQRAIDEIVLPFERGEL